MRHDECKNLSRSQSQTVLPWGLGPWRSKQNKKETPMGSWVITSLSIIRVFLHHQVVLVAWNVTCKMLLICQELCGPREGVWWPMLRSFEFKFGQCSNTPVNLGLMSRYVMRVMSLKWSKCCHLGCVLFVLGGTFEQLSRCSKCVHAFVKISSFEYQWISLLKLSLYMYMGLYCGVIALVEVVNAYSPL